MAINLNLILLRSLVSGLFFILFSPSVVTHFISVFPLPSRIYLKGFVLLRDIARRNFICPAAVPHMAPLGNFHSLLSPRLPLHFPAAIVPQAGGKREQKKQQH